MRALQVEVAAKTVREANASPRVVFIYFSGAYCPQSSRYVTGTTASRLLDIEPVLEAARKAKANGSTRFCMGAAWRDLTGRKRGFERILEMVREVRKMDMEVCTTLGMLSPSQAKQLKEAYAFRQSQIAVRPDC
jgi:biotin synthase-like enzyme